MRNHLSQYAHWLLDGDTRLETQQEKSIFWSKWEKKQRKNGQDSDFIALFHFSYRFKVNIYCLHCANSHVVTRGGEEIVTLGGGYKKYVNPRFLINFFVLHDNDHFMHIKGLTPADFDLMCAKHGLRGQVIDVSFWA